MLGKRAQLSQNGSSEHPSPGEAAVGPLLWQPALRACMSAPETLYKWKTQNTALALTPPVNRVEPTLLVNLTSCRGRDLIQMSPALPHSSVRLP